MFAKHIIESHIEIEIIENCTNTLQVSAGDDLVPTATKLELLGSWFGTVGESSLDSLVATGGVNVADVVDVPAFSVAEP